MTGKKLVNCIAIFEYSIMDMASYQVFLRFNFEFGKAKIKLKIIARQKHKSIKIAKSTLEIKEAEEVKETRKVDDIE